MRIRVKRWLSLVSKLNLHPVKRDDHAVFCGFCGKFVVCAVDEVADVAEDEFCIFVRVAVRAEKVCHFDAPIKIHVRLCNLLAALEGAVHRDEIKDDTRSLEPFDDLGEEFARVVRPEDALARRLNHEDHGVGRVSVTCGEGSYGVVEDFYGLEVFKRMNLGACPCLGVALARCEIRLVLFDDCADSRARALADIEIHRLAHAAHAAEKIGGEEMVVMVVRDEDVANLGHIEPRKGAMMEGVNREVDRESAVKQSLRACSDILSARLARVTADSAVAKDLGDSVAAARSVVFYLHFEYSFLLFGSKNYYVSVVAVARFDKNVQPPLLVIVRVTLLNTNSQREACTRRTAFRKGAGGQGSSEAFSLRELLASAAASKLQLPLQVNTTSLTCKK